MRDKIVFWICRFLINHLATKWYRQRVEIVMDLGMREYLKRLEALEEKLKEEKICLGHPAEDGGDPHASIGDIFYCDGSCRKVVDLDDYRAS